MIRRIAYIHQLPDWPYFNWKEAALSALLAETRHRQGLLLGRMAAMGLHERDEANLRSLTQEVVESSEIEGETLDADQVRSSLARRLGLDAGGVAPVERDVEGVVDMMLDATQNYRAPLSADRLFGWHSALFPTGRSGLTRIKVGDWRDDAEGPMQVVSGPIGRERVHFEAPAAERLPAEMQLFLKWAERDDEQLDPVLRAGLAHLWFVTIHPFDDGNGRIARAVGEYMLARADRSARRYYSMSAQIRQERADYYDLLEATQKGDTDVTAWLMWFLSCLGRAFDRAEESVGAVMAKARFWDRARELPLNARQTRVLNRLLDGFEGKLTSSKWAALAKTSQDTAARDIQQLVDWGLLARGPGSGRSTHYVLVGKMRLTR